MVFSSSSENSLSLVVVPQLLFITFKLFIINKKLQFYFTRRKKQGNCRAQATQQWQPEHSNSDLRLLRKNKIIILYIKGGKIPKN